MATSTVGENRSLVDFLTAHTDLPLCHSASPQDLPDRRVHPRFKPAEPVTLRLDVMGEIWSAEVKEVCGESACLQLDREIAERIADGQPASLWLESTRGMPLRLDGSLNTLRTPPDPAPHQSIPMTFVCAP
jgi:hypothetical protein